MSIEAVAIILGALTTFFAGAGAAHVAYLRGRQGIKAENERLKVELQAAQQKIADDAADRRAKRATDKVGRVTELQRQYTLLASDLRKEIEDLRKRLDATDERERACQAALNEARQHHADSARLVAELEGRLVLLEGKQVSA